MKLNIPIRYLEAYLPTPRCRKLRHREATTTIEVDVPSLSIDSAHKVFIVHDFSIHEGKYVDEPIYQYAGVLWKRAYKNDYFSGAPHAPATSDTLWWMLTSCRTCGVLEDAERERNKAREYAKEFLLLDGELYTACGEPMYEIHTLGLGHNHGVGWGTTIDIAYCYNSSISKDRYFTALERDEAIHTALRIAKSRGDTKAFDHLRNLEDNIKVLCPAAVKRNPAKEHDDGDPFLNMLDGLCAGSDSPAEAAALVMATTSKEISK